MDAAMTVQEPDEFGAGERAYFDALLDVLQRIEPLVWMVGEAEHLNAGFDAGLLSGAQTLIEHSIDPEYPPFRAWCDGAPHRKLSHVLARSHGSLRDGART